MKVILCDYQKVINIQLSHKKLNVGQGFTLKGIQLLFLGLSYLESSFLKVFLTMNTSFLVEFTTNSFKVLPGLRGPVVSSIRVLS